jgi:hypothetical protein
MGGDAVPTAVSSVGGAFAGRSELRSIEVFDAIVLNLPASVVISAGTEPSLEISADDGVLPLIQSTVSESVLDLRAASDANFQNARISIRAVVPALRALTVNGAGDVQISSFVVQSLQIDLNGIAAIALQPVTAESITVNLAGTGSIDFATATAITFSVNMGGSGRISAAGNVEELLVTSPGGGEFVGQELTARAARFDIAGTLTAFVSVLETLDVQMSGGGTVTFGGTPQVNASITGSGSVRDSAGNIVAGSG